MLTIFIDELCQAFRDMRMLVAISAYAALLGLAMKGAMPFAKFIEIFFEMQGSPSPISLPLIFVYFISLCLLPLLILLLGYSTFAQEIESKTARLLASRVSRKGIFLGKLAGLITITVLVPIFFFFFAAAYLHVRSDIQMSILLLLYIIYFTSAITLCSCIARTGKQAFLLSIALLIAPALFFNCSLSPYHYFSTLSVTAPALGVLLTFSAAFLAIGYIIFWRRDL